MILIRYINTFLVILLCIQHQCVQILKYSVHISVYTHVIDASDWLAGVRLCLLFWWSLFTTYIDIFTTFVYIFRPVGQAYFPSTRIARSSPDVNIPPSFYIFFPDLKYSSRFLILLPDFIFLADLRNSYLIVYISSWSIFDFLIKKNIPAWLPAFSRESFPGIFFFVFFGGQESPLAPLTGQPMASIVSWPNFIRILLRWDGLDGDATGDGLSALIAGLQPGTEETVWCATNVPSPILLNSIHVFPCLITIAHICHVSVYDQICSIGV